MCLWGMPPPPPFSPLPHTRYDSTMVSPVNASSCSATPCTIYGPGVTGLCCGVPGGNLTDWATLVPDGPLSALSGDDVTIAGTAAPDVPLVALQLCVTSAASKVPPCFTVSVDGEMCRVRFIEGGTSSPPHGLYTYIPPPPPLTARPLVLPPYISVPAVYPPPPPSPLSPHPPSQVTTASSVYPPATCPLPSLVVAGTQLNIPLGSTDAAWTASTDTWVVVVLRKSSLASATLSSLIIRDADGSVVATLAAPVTLSGGNAVTARRRRRQLLKGSVGRSSSTSSRSSSFSTSSSSGSKT